MNSKHKLKRNKNGDLHGYCVYDWRNGADETDRGVFMNGKMIGYWVWKANEPLWDGFNEVKRYYIL